MTENMIENAAPAEGQERIGVYVCHCGTNIAGIVDVVQVAEWAAAKLKHRGVIIAREYKFMCSSLGQELIEKDIKELGLNRVVVAACSPHLHEKTFRNACANAGLNPFLCEMVSIREQVSWVHTDKVAATAKAKAMISGGVERVRQNTPLQPITVPISPGHACGGRRHRRDSKRIGDCRRGFPRLSGGTRTVPRRTHGSIRQDLPDAGLFRLHSHSEDGGRRLASQHHLIDLERSGESGRIYRQLHRDGPEAGAQDRRRTVHRLRNLPGENARRKSLTMSMRPGWDIAKPCTRPSHRLCRIFR